MFGYTNGQWMLILGNAAYILGFGAYYLLQENYEFLWYVAVMVFFFAVLVLTIKRVQLPLSILWGLSLWGLLHMAGGGVRIGDDVLYAYVVLPLIEQGELLLIKYDQLVHAFGFGVTTLVVHHLMGRYVEPMRRGFVYFLLIVMAGTGFGVLNEIVEFTAVLAFSETGVGGYYNTALDLVFNTLGAVLAGYGIYRYERVRRSSLEPEAAPVT